MKVYHQPKLVLLCIVMLSTQFVFSQDTKSAILFSNHTDLLFTTEVSISGDESMVDIGKSDILAWEGGNHHDLGDRVINTILDVVFNIDISHNTEGYLVECERFAFLGDKSHDVEIDILNEGEIVFTIEYKFVDTYFDLNNPTLYNVRYPDNVKDVENPYALSVEEHHSPHEATREIFINNRSYKLIYGTFNNERDPTNNIIFSLSETEPTTLNYEADIAEVDDPTILNVLTYNIGLLMPLGANDQEEMERVPVLHQAIPKNMDIIMWQEMFEEYWVNIIIDSLKDYYPYVTSPHNMPTIPGLTKNGGCLIMSKHPILEEDDFSYARDAGIVASGESIFADKGVKYAKVNKNGQIIHVFNSHTSGQAIENDAMGKWMNERVEPNYDDIVIMGGDMNTGVYSGKYYQMVDSLSAITPTYNTLQSRDLVTRGTTWGYNHYGKGRTDIANLIDYVFASSKFKVPTLHYNETQAYRLNITNKPFWGVFDLGDHQPVYSRMEFPTISGSINDSEVCTGDNFDIQIETSLDDYSITWFKDDLLLPNENGLSLVRNNITELDFGSYRCELTYNYEADASINGDTYGNTITIDTIYVDSVMNDTLIIDTIIMEVSTVQYEAYQHPGKEEGKLVRTFLVGPDTTICPALVSSIHGIKTIELQIFPNPITDFLDIKIKGQYKVKVLDGKGAIVYDDIVVGNSTIETKHWAKGIYYIEFYENDLIVHTESIAKQ